MSTIGSYLKEFFLVPFRGRTYLNLIYLGLAFPLGVVYFIVLAGGVGLGLGLILLWIGLLILVLMIPIWWVFIAAERWQAKVFLRAELGPSSKPGDGEVSLWQRFVHMLKNPVTWKGLIFLIAKGPIGLIDFTALVLYFILTLAFIFAPLYYQWGTIDLGFTMVDSLWKAIILSVGGVGCGFFGLHVLNGMAYLQKMLAVALLGNAKPRVAEGVVEMPGEQHLIDDLSGNASVGSSVTYEQAGMEGVTQNETEVT